MKDDKKSLDSIVINEVQLLLAEKRTSLSVMRTGISVLALPLSVLSVLIATSKYYDIFHVMNMLITVMKRALSSTKNYKIGLSELF